MLNRCAVLLAGSLLSVVTTVQAADPASSFPSRPIRLIVTFAPGGGTDLAARVVATALGELWNGTVIVDNRGGAGGLIGTELTAKAAPDGYTVMLCTIGSHAITPARYKKLSYDQYRDFTPVAMVGLTPNVFMSFPGFAPKNLQEFISYAKANPGKVSFGSSGVGASPHMSIELFKIVAGIDIVHVPYKGAAPALADVMGGQMPTSVGNLPGGPLAAIKAGRVRGLGVTTAQRNKQAPDVPTFAESGVPGFDVSSWYGICAPAGLPKPILNKFNAGLVKVLSRPDIQQRLEDQGIDVKASTPEEFLAHIRMESERWKKVVEQGKLGAE